LAKEKAKNLFEPKRESKEMVELCDMIAVFAVWSDLGLRSEAIKLMTVTN
jgi:hypothetical protein